MGGFAFEIRTEPTQTPSSIDPIPGQMCMDKEKETQNARAPEIYYISAKAIVSAIDAGILPTDTVPVEEILDRSKSTLFTKLLTLGQVLYFLAQFCVRWGRGLPNTPLEVGVVAFVVCAIFTYVFVLYKPKDVGLVITLARFCFKGNVPKNIRDWCDAERGDVCVVDISNERPLPLPQVNAGGAAILFGVIVGAIHLTGWNLHYHTLADTWLWRGASIYITVAGLGLLAILLVDFGESVAWLVRIAVVLYAIARVILLVEMFRSLFYLPQGAFVSTWAENVPHIG